jgi:glycosyltransferase involved in cell wall biosynthesis
LRIYDTLRRELFWTQQSLPQAAARAQCGVLHSPAMLAPLKCRLPVVLTIFDLYIIRRKKSFPLWNSKSMNYFLPKILNSSSHIIAISQFTKQEIMEIYPHLPESKITVTLLGLEPNFKRVRKDESLKIKNKYSLSKPYIMGVSTIEPRKNIKNLISSFARIQKKIEQDLVLVGGYGWKSADLMKLTRRINLEKRIKFLGYVPKNDLPALYSLADGFVYPSLYEGFGLPPLEAMACGCPVITSNCASIPEVVGTAAVLIDPKNIEELSCAMETLMGDENKRASLRIAGMKRAADFSWEKCAKKTIEVYEQSGT